ncbi:MAG: hypothetical protein A2Y12_01360 [Planctomycetes bacterium GWF2_42_9]|nr:MAG: hypothetical protein A2Y12_01360 [Planctomycetes bacterium GWF2_42_9]
METKQISGWQLIRSARQADTALNADTYDSKPDYAKNICMEGINSLDLMLAAIGDENGTVEVRLFGGRNKDAGPAQLIATITFTLGAMVVNQDPQNGLPTDLQFFADTAAITSYWPVDIKAPNSGNNLICVISFDALDLAWIAAEIGTMTNVTRADVFMGYFR